VLVTILLSHWAWVDISGKVIILMVLLGFAHAILGSIGEIRETCSSLK
jgi:hypothetical protein